MSSRMEHLTISFFAVLEERGQMNLLQWCMHENLISSRYECPKCGKNMVLRERKGTIDGYEWRCRTKGGENPHDEFFIARAAFLLRPGWLQIFFPLAGFFVDRAVYPLRPGWFKHFSIAEVASLQIPGWSKKFRQPGWRFFKDQDSLNTFFRSVQSEFIHYISSQKLHLSNYSCRRCLH
ncbi:hypothetical protein TNCV_2027251 [Trichonephila clavipes]|nr:hypothetical protein TNCV_2027251 [Trichonephila clavipes]